MSGWFAMKRGIHEHPIFRKQPERLFVWSWIVANAAWKDTRQDANGNSVAVRRGQLLTSFRQMSDATGVGVKVIRNLIDRLISENAIGTDTGTGRILITIHNYDKYQSPVRSRGTPEGTGGAQEGHTKETSEPFNHTPPSEEAAEPPFPVSPITSSLWEKGKPYLARYGVPNPGAVIGKWLRDYEGDALRILAAFDAAMKAGTHEPIPYITAILEGSNGRGHSASRAANERFNATLEQIARTAGLSET